MISIPKAELKHFFTDTLFFNEVYNYSFASYIDTQFEEKTDQIVSISNTMPEEYKYLRNSVYPSLLKNIYTNIDRFETIKIFEYARTYHKNTSELPEEKRWFGFAIVNPKKTQEQNILEDDFIIARTYMENLLKNLNIHTFKLQNETKEYFHPKCSVEIIENDKKYQCLIEICDLDKKTLALSIDKNINSFNMLIVKGVKKT